MTTFDFQKGELLLINKPYTWTSFQVVNKLRHSIRRYLAHDKIKIGHAGTLDPLATGLLILCTGKLTKKIDEFSGMEKEYTGTFTLGSTTPSFDLETPVTKQSDLEKITNELIYHAINKFVGTIDQVPPVYSAMKIDGKRAYEFARSGKGDIEMKSRCVQIHTFEITGIKLPVVDFRVVCGKGTYIRSLARDFGEELGCGAYLSSLCRTRIGDYKLEDAMAPEMFCRIVELV